MAAATYPFFGKVAELIGRLSAIQVIVQLQKYIDACVKPTVSARAPGA